MHRFSLAGRILVLTGAGRGVGRALVQQLVAKGAKGIIAVGRDGARLRELHESVPTAVPFVADLSDPAQVDGLVAFVKANAADTSVLINNAGTQLLTDLVDPESDVTPENSSRRS